jgi:hypothetical protein
VFQNAAAETGRPVRTVALGGHPGITLPDPVGPPQVRAAMRELIPGFRGRLLLSAGVRALRAVGGAGRQVIPPFARS